MTAIIARLKITLDDMEPAVIRCVETPFDITLDRLHLLIQAAMGWTNSHFYELRAGNVGWGMPDPDWPDGPLDARKARLADVVEDVGTKTLRYIYDFGDGWEHTIKIERLGDPTPGVAYPRLIEAPGATENCSKRSPIRSMSDTPSSRNGSPTTSTRLSSIPKGWSTMSLPSPRNGRANQPPSTRAAPDRGLHRTVTLIQGGMCEHQLSSP